MKRELFSHLTKWRLFKNTVLSAVMGVLIFGTCVLFAVVLVVALIFADSLRTFLDTLIFTTSLLAVTLPPFGCFLVAGSISPFFLIYEQERLLKFSFSDEMRKRSITDMNYKDDQWFIYTHKIQVLVINRDYVHKVISISDSFGSRMYAVLTIIRCDGIKKEISLHHDIATKLKKWLLEVGLQDGIVDNRCKR